jgi:negative regulator of sigma E activity
MTAAEIIAHNEALARSGVIRAYRNGDLLEAMRLCQLYTGQDAQSAYQTVKEWCE